MIKNIYIILIKKIIIKLIFFGFVLGDLKLYSTENKLNCQSLEC
jgi:hypothetical protein